MGKQWSRQLHSVLSSFFLHLIYVRVSQLFSIITLNKILEALIFTLFFSHFHKNFQNISLSLQSNSLYSVLSVLSMWFSKTCTALEFILFIPFAICTNLLFLYLWKIIKLYSTGLCPLVIHHFMPAAPVMELLKCGIATGLRGSFPSTGL